MKGLAGEEVDYIVTWLEMRSRPARLEPQPEPHANPSLIASNVFPVEDFFAMYDAVGKDYAWDDMHLMPGDRASAFLKDPAVSMSTMFLDGRKQGFFLLDARLPTTLDIAYLGLIPNAIGKRLGKWLLGQAVRAAWSRPRTRKVTVNTCTLDHPGALPMYLRSGFCPVRTERRSRMLLRDTILQATC